MTNVNISSRPTWMSPQEWIFTHLSRTGLETRDQRDRADQDWRGYVTGVVQSQVFAYTSKKVKLVFNAKFEEVAGENFVQIHQMEYPLTVDGALEHQIWTYGEKVVHVVQANFDDIEDGEIILGTAYIVCERSYVSPTGL